MGTRGAHFWRGTAGLYPHPHIVSLHYTLQSLIHTIHTTSSPLHHCTCIWPLVQHYWSRRLMKLCTCCHVCTCRYLLVSRGCVIKIITYARETMDLQGCDGQHNAQNNLHHQWCPRSPLDALSMATGVHCSLSV